MTEKTPLPKDIRLELIEKWKGIDKISEEDLEANGLVRIERDGGFHLLKKEEHERREALKSEEERSAKSREELLKVQKEKNVPFGELEVTIQRSKEMMFRDYGEEDERAEVIWEEVGRLEKWLQDLHEGELEWKDIIPRDLPFFTFVREFSAFISSYPAGATNETDARIRRAAAPLVIPRMTIPENVIPGDIDFTRDSDTSSLPSSAAERLHKALERGKGTFGETPHIRRQLAASEKFADLKDAVSAAYFDAGDSERAMSSRMMDEAAHGAWAKARVLHAFFTSRGYAMESLREDAGPPDIRRMLQALEKKLDALPSGRALIDARKRMREMTSVDEKKAFSKEFSDLEEKAHAEKHLIKGAEQYFEPSAEIASAVRRRISSMQAQLVLASSSSEKSEAMRLVGSIDPMLDSNPGAVSGDCTEDEPLPFLKHDNPFYNVKIFSEGAEHIGNIYLACVTTKRGTPAWHLDAIQIPYGYKWNEDTIGIIIRALGEAALKKGVGYITVNSESYGISNYGYIQRAVLAYHRLVGGRRLHLVMPKDPDTERAREAARLEFLEAERRMNDPQPEFPDYIEEAAERDEDDDDEGYSWLQGTGRASRVLWSRPQTGKK